MKRILVGLLIFIILILFVACDNDINEKLETEIKQSLSGEMKEMKLAYYTGKFVVMLTEFVFSNI
jgi:hypothetical protein